MDFLQLDLLANMSMECLVLYFSFLISNISDTKASSFSKGNEGLLPTSLLFEQQSREIRATSKVNDLSMVGFSYFGLHFPQEREMSHAQ